MTKCVADIASRNWSHPLYIGMVSVKPGSLTEFEDYAKQNGKKLDLRYGMAAWTYLKASLTDPRPGVVTHMAYSEDKGGARVRVESTSKEQVETVLKEVAGIIGETEDEGLVHDFNHDVKLQRIAATATKKVR
jgi:hypothetical protein